MAAMKPAVLIALLFSVPASLLALQCNSTMSDIDYPVWDPAPYSCRNRCGQVYNNDICGCDKVCTVYGDCCENYQNECLSPADETSGESTVSISASMNAVNSSNSSMTAGSTTSVYVTSYRGQHLDTSTDQFTAMSTNDDGQVTGPPPRDLLETTTDPGESLVDPVLEMIECRSRARLVSACPNPSALLLDSGPLVFGAHKIAVEEVEERCQTPWEQAEDDDILRIMPMTDAVSGHHFTNVYCLLCHGGRLQHAKPWTQSIWWSQRALADLKQPSPRNLYQLLQQARESGAKTVALPPEGVYARRCLPKTSFSYLCDCPTLKEKCEQGQPSYIIGNGILFRNYHCLLCHFVAIDANEYKIMTPDISKLIFMRNRNEFSTLMKWASGAVNGDRAELNLVTEKEIVSWLVGWHEMSCTSRVSDSVYTATPQASTTDKESVPRSTDTEHVVSNSAGDDASPDKIPGGETSFSRGNEVTTDSKHLQPDVGPSTPVHERAWAGYGLSPVPRVLTEGTPGSNTECQERVCLDGIPLLDGMCRNDLREYEVNMKITCASTSDGPLASQPTASETSLVEGLLQDKRQRLDPDLTQAVHESVLTVLPGSTVNVISISLAQDRCTLIVTIYLVLSTTDVYITKNQWILAYALQLAATESLRSELASLGQPLFVCTYVKRVSPYFNPTFSDDTCLVTTTMCGFPPSVAAAKRHAGKLDVIIAIVMFTNLLAMA